MAPHPLESQYGLTALELLDAIGSRFRLKDRHYSKDSELRFSEPQEAAGEKLLF